MHLSSRSLLGVTVVLTLASCDGGKNVSFDTLETQRAIANDNSKFNAQKWRAENGYESLNILARGDSSQQANCPMGDGWATIDLIDPKTKQSQLKLKCSTVSAQVGCWKEDDFKARAQLASQDGPCNRTLPENLKKIEQ
jgi:post-segregation antitoxin (ccd killing protein)